MMDADARPLALLIPGLDGTGLLFYRQLEALECRYRVRPWSYRPGASLSMRGLIRDLDRETAAEKPKSILVVAESFGGLVAINYVSQCPERVARLVLVNTFPFYRSRLRIRLAHALTPLLKFGAGRKIKEWTIDYVLRKEGIPVDDRQRFQVIARQIGLADYRRRLQLILETDVRSRLREITVPTILLASGRDKIVPSVQEAHFMEARIPNASVHEFPEAGHALLLTPGVSLADYVG